MVQGKTIGLIGFGRAGSAVAARLHGWEVRILVADPYADPAVITAAGAELAPLETVLREADVISLHAFLSPETQGLIGEAELRQMKDSAYLVNLGRGGLVDQPALIRALQEGWIAGAALDVFATEPLPADSPLRAIPPERLIMTPHVAGFSREGEEAGPRTVFENLKRGLAGEPPLYLLNPAVLPAWRERLARLGVPGAPLAADSIAATS
jgi:phosphoglycerate dehydrogenase-like enzyme